MKLPTFILEDIGANRVHQHLTPGKGAIDFRSIFAACRRDRVSGVGHGGTISV